MDAQEIRLRALEVIASGGGQRDPRRLITDAKALVEWIEADTAKPTAPSMPQKKVADKA